MTDVQATFFATLIDEWVRGGITDAVIAPGNRSSLLSALLISDGRIQVHVVVDERSASFFALGIGKATGRPAVLWTTSGTAAAELHAAVIEAHQASVPLLVCTSDRPPELHHTRDWQSVDQTRIYGSAPRWQFDPGVASVAMSGSWRSIAARSVLETISHPLGPGPVHLNLAIREPWQPVPGELPRGRQDKQPWHQSSELEVESTGPQTYRPQSRGLFVVGEGDVDVDVVHVTARRLGWPVVAEMRSGCRLQTGTTIENFDLLAKSEIFRKHHAPEVVVHMGSSLVSKAFNAWIADCGAEQWFVSPHDDWTGGIAFAEHIVRADPTAFCESIDVEPAPESWLAGWRNADELTRNELDVVLGGDGLSEPAVARVLVRDLRDGFNLFAATSMPVRDIETYGAARDGLHVYANRGASGMDGLISTAAGIAFATKRPTAMLTGDLSFLYDVGALWALGNTSSPVNLVIVVIDNNGGGIFSHVAQLTSLEPNVFERVVATPHNSDIQRVANGFGVKTESVGRMRDLMPAVNRAIDEGGIRVVYIRTERAAQVAVRDSVAKAVADALSTC